MTRGSVTRGSGLSLLHFFKLWLGRRNTVLIDFGFEFEFKNLAIPTRTALALISNRIRSHETFNNDVTRTFKLAS